MRTGQKLHTFCHTVSVHQRNLQLLMIEIYKTKSALNSPCMEKDIFVDTANTYNLRSNDGILLPRANTTALGIETKRCTANRLWQILLSKINQFRNLTVFNATVGFAKYIFGRVFI